ncbi:MAG TPA: CoA pyrophosphatase [Polyangiaceae bacterium]|nr:CoA pyrophosphatase [Polyangiaceae bacterium]
MSSFERIAAPDGALLRAAVACAIVSGDGDEACFVITRRSDRPGRHSGQWALPGGRIEKGEDAPQAALRELAEEVGLRASPEDVLGLLDDYETRSGFVITPVVVWLDPRGTLVPDPREVAAVYEVPLASLEAPDVPSLWTIPESSRTLIGIPLRELDTVIHAPTAAVLFQLREVALVGRATRVAEYEQPVFAWR